MQRRSYTILTRNSHLTFFVKVLNKYKQTIRYGVKCIQFLSFVEDFFLVPLIHVLGKVLGMNSQLTAAFLSNTVGPAFQPLTDYF